MHSFDVAYWFRLLPTPSNIPPVRANAVIVVVIVVVDVTVRRNAKKKYNAQPVYLLPFFCSPSNSHILYIGR